MGRIVVFDVETTGLDPKVDHIVEFGAVVFNLEGEELKDYNSLVKTKLQMSRKVMSIHGITHQMLNEHGKKWSEVAPVVQDLLTDCDYWCGQNLQFDIGFVKEAMKGVGCELEKKPVLDSLTISRRFIPTSVLRGKSLQKLCEFLMVPLDSAHRAVHDARATGLCMFKLGSELGLSVEELIDTEAKVVGKWCLGTDPFEAQFVGLPTHKFYD